MTDKTTIIATPEWKAEAIERLKADGAFDLSAQAIYALAGDKLDELCLTDALKVAGFTHRSLGAGAAHEILDGTETVVFVGRAGEVWDWLKARKL